MEKKTSFTIYPAVDIRSGKVVRLVEGDPARQTAYEVEPLTAARRWKDAGAEWLHVVNLDGAFGSGNGESLLAVKALLGVLRGEIKIQVGGGLRSLKEIEDVLTWGADRAVLGTIAVEKPEVAVKALQSFGPERIALALDARDGIVQVHGWQGGTGITAEALGKAFYRHGLATAIFTDIRRDGGGTGTNIEAARDLAANTQLEVIASGGARSLDDVQRAKAAGLSGIILGRALYEGSIDLREALQCR